MERIKKFYEKTFGYGYDLYLYLSLILFLAIFFGALIKIANLVLEIYKPNI